MQDQLSLTGGADRRAYGFDDDRLGYELQDDEIIVDSFAGAGGMSYGIRWATGREPDVAINHWPEAINTHEYNHPSTTHYSASVYALDPREVAAGRKVGIFWASPDCRSHSRARGGAPKSKSVRDLAWVVVHWAKLTFPRALGIENVSEFRDWCPLDSKGRAIKEKKGETFRAWVAELESLGYTVEWRILNAADYGAPTTRKRLFIQARRDGLPILWPAETHGAPDNALVEAGMIAPWRTAAECIDYERPTNSIFLTKEEAKEAGCKRPLSEKTMKRVARGLFRQVINAERPYIVEYGAKPTGSEENPFAANDRTPGVVIPLTHQGDLRFHSPDAPMPTITGANRGELAWVSPFFARTAHGEVDAKGRKRGRGDHGPLEPYPTVTSSQDSALICPTLVQTGYGEREGQKPRSLDINSPLGTVVAGGSKHALVAAMLHCNNQNAIGSTPAQPLKTVMAGSARHVYIDAHLEGQVDRSKQVADFLWEHRDLSEVEVTRDSVGTLLLGGVPLRITDIGLRMMCAEELASAQGFDASFDPSTRVETDENGNKKLVKNTATAMVKMIGNSVSPPVGAAVIGAMIGRGHDEKGRTGDEILDSLKRKAA
ncbi:DNA cytosine methyltransferase [uncultured Salinicola sp.]|uniref:DNA cytosine methyltransferase n=1 Tax=uncultured Salinicola sp. TaxID=1193542 RepID=UPI0026017F11|nr:DNA cytosine methyltransferase [uncultured Salinicola sp.]